VGFKSGCSGCVATKLCNFIVVEEAIDESFCLSTATLERVTPQIKSMGIRILDGERDGICPEDPREEPSLRPAGKNSVAAQLTGIRSHAYDSHYCAFPTEDAWFVDRFVYSVLNDDLYNDGLNDVCNGINSRRLSALGRSAFPPCPLEVEADRQCLKLWADFFCTSRCPAYGKPLPGFCKSSYDRLAQACEHSTAPGRCVPETEALLPYLAPEDGILPDQCQNMFEIKHTSQLDLDFGLDEPVPPCRPVDCQILDSDGSEPVCLYTDCEVAGSVALNAEYFVSQPSCGGRTCEEVIAEDLGVSTSDFTSFSCDGSCEVSIVGVAASVCSPIPLLTVPHYSIVHENGLNPGGDDNEALIVNSITVDSDTEFSFTLTVKTESCCDGFYIYFSNLGEGSSYGASSFRTYLYDAMGGTIYGSAAFWVFDDDANPYGPSYDWVTFSNVNIPIGEVMEPGNYRLRLGYYTDGSCGNTCSCPAYNMDLTPGPGTAFAPHFFGFAEVAIDTEPVTFDSVGSKFVSNVYCPLDTVNYGDDDYCDGGEEF
jgi:hypothetical protein